MKVVLIFLAGLLVATAAIFGYRAYMSPEPEEKIAAVPEDAAIATPTPFDPKVPPSNSLVGGIIDYTGDILRQERLATEPAELAGSSDIVQGERVVTQEDATMTIAFDGFLFELDPESDLTFVQTLPIDFVVTQRSGTISYTAESDIPLSIRIRSALITKPSGTISIAMEDGDPGILIRSLTGPTKIGFNDLEWESQVFDLAEGQIYEFDSDERTALNVTNLY